MKKIKLILLGIVAVLCSCVNNNYDLNKDISKDVKIDGNKITLPFGSLKVVTLDSLIDVDDVEVLEKSTDGVYSINKSDSISPITETVDPIELSIEEQNETVEIEFTDAEIDAVEVKAKDVEPAIFTIPEISFDELNNSLPELEANASQTIENSGLKNKLNTLSTSGVSGNVTVSIEDVGLSGTSHRIDSVVEYQFEQSSYELPKEIKSVSKIELATALDNDELDTKGTLIKAKITRPKGMANAKSSICFRIEFPKNYVLALKYEDNKAYKLIGNNVIYVENLPVVEDNTYVEFYIKDIIEVEKLTVENGRVISFENLSEIYYTLDYIMESGTIIVEPKSIGDVDEYIEENFSFNISFNAALAFCNVEGETNEINVAFDNINMDFDGSFDGLEHIQRINYIDFESDKSRLKFRTEMKKEDAELLKELKIKEGYALKVEFPQELVFDIAKSEHPIGTEYDSEKHAFYINRFDALDGGIWNLALDSLKLNLPVVDEKCDFAMSAKIFVVDSNDAESDSIVLSSFKMDDLSTMLDKLKDEKSVIFTMEDTELIIYEASVNTDRISSDLEKDVDISFDEEVPTEIASIKSIDFTDNVTVKFEMMVDGLNDLDADVNLDMNVKLPSFLHLEESKNCHGVDYLALNDDNTLDVRTIYNPNKNKENIIIELLCTSLDFSGAEFSNEGLIPVDSIDLKFIQYSGGINVTGDAYIESSNFSSKQLDEIGENIMLDIKFMVDTIKVRSFHGIYDGEIDESKEQIDLDLGDELDFLKDGGNQITLAEPQIEISLNNSVSVPVDVDLTIRGRDDNGVVLSEIFTELKIQPADYDEKSGVITAKDTKLFLTSDTSRVSKAGYDNVEVRGLATMLNNKVPSIIDLVIKPSINTESTHHIDITKDIEFSGDYSVNIPLKFDNLNICYTDSVEDLSEDLAEALEKMSNVSLDLKMNIVNTLPLNLDLTVIPYDIKGKLIEDITVEPVLIKAGEGGSINDPELSEVVQQVTIVVKSKGKSISLLDKIVLKAVAMDHTVGGEALRCDQGLKVTDVVVELEGDIETELD